MNLLSQTYDSLIDIKYFGQNEENIDEFEKRVKNVVEFSKIVSFLSKRLKRLLPDIEEFVNPIDSDDEKNTLFLEICSLLKELSCPYKAFSEGDIHARFDSLENKLQLIDFLLSEVQAAQIIAVSKKSQSSSEHGSVRSDESEETKALKQILTTLGIPKPPVHVTVNEIWAKIEQKLQSLLTTLPKSHLGKPLFNSTLSEDQWKKLMEINQLLCEDFQMRRELLLTRLDVTVQSFKWADRLKSSNQEIATIYQTQRRQLSSKPGVKLFMLLSARDDLCKQEKTCSSRLMTRSNLHKIIIPKVPDRGGRTGELQPPPPEMPAFMQRRNTPGGQHHHQQQPQDQRRQGGRGGRNQGNNYWCNEGPNFRPKSEFEKFNDPNYGDNSGRGNGGGHGGGRGGYRGGGGGGGGGYRGGGRGGRY